MLKSRFMTPVLLVLLLAGFGLGVVWLFQLRFDSGDIYPPYSSLRADPLGTKALYESLQGIPGLAVGRFLQDANKLRGGPDRSFLFLGVDSDDLTVMTQGDLTALENCLFSGGRVVITLLPAAPNENQEQSRPKLSAGEKKKQALNPDTNTPPEMKTVSLPAKVGLRLARDFRLIEGVPPSRARWAGHAAPSNGLPSSMSWHSTVYFADLDSQWKVLYQRGDYPVMIERPFGKGSLVLASDSYFASNEALRKERLPGLLAWLTGGRREILFDETHLGVHERPGVASLLRQYHLEGVLIGLLFVAGLFVWQNSAPLVPPFPDEPVEGGTATVQGKEATAGFASLLRRAIPPGEILAVCFAEWKSACARRPRAAARLPAVEQVIAAEQSQPVGARQPVAAWRAVQHILTERK